MCLSSLFFSLDSLLNSDWQLHDDDDSGTWTLHCVGADDEGTSGRNGGKVDGI